MTLASRQLGEAGEVGARGDKAVLSPVPGPAGGHQGVVPQAFRRPVVALAEEESELFVRAVLGGARASGSLLSAVKAMHQGLEPGPRPSQRHEEHVRVPSHAVSLDRDDARRARLAHVVVPRAAVCRQPVRESSSSTRQALGTTVLLVGTFKHRCQRQTRSRAARCRRGASRPAGGAGRGARF